MQLKSIIEIVEENKTDFFSYLNKVVLSEKKLCVKGDHLKLLNSLKKELKNDNYKILLEIIKHVSESVTLSNTCLLYTSDAADERSSVDLGGRRIIKKKK